MLRFHRFGLRAVVVCLVSAALLLAVPGDGVRGADEAPPQGLRVFYTGHSFHMFVPGLVEQMVKQAGIQNHKLAGAQGIGGSRVIQHWDLEGDKQKVKPALMTGEIDVLTMAPHVKVPDEGITKLVELGLKHNPSMQFLVQASWYPFDVADPQQRIKDNLQRNDKTIADLQAAVDVWRKQLEEQVQELNTQHGRDAVHIIPVGDAVVKLRALVVAGKFPGITTQAELFTDPIGHAGPHVRALAAYCNYAAIYHRDPAGLSVMKNEITDEQQALLQQLAWETVSKYPLSGVKP